MNYLKKNAGLISKLALLVICFLLFIPNMSNYPFIDTNETKLVSIAKDMLNNSDWINIKLNGNNVFNIPPFFVWITNLSCIIFGKISQEVVRLPIAISTILGIYAIFTTLKGILRKTYSFIIAIIMATCLGTLVFSRLATNDMLFTISTMVAILFAYRTIFKEKTKYWAGIYFFSTIAFLSGGLFGILIPLISIIAMHIFTGKLKEAFNLKHIFMGLLIFSILTIPYYSIMLYKHGIVFIQEYLSSYNFLKYSGIKETATVIGLFILGFTPWAFSFLWILGQKSKKILDTIISYFKDNSQAKLKEKWEELPLIDKFLSLNTIVFIISSVFAILYGSKYTFLILFTMFPASCITGNYWYEYIIKKEHDKSIFFATMIPNLILIVCSLLGLLGHNKINEILFHGLHHLFIPLIVIFFVIPIISIFAVILKGRIEPFVANIILMVSLSFVITPNIFNFITANGGENDLINFARIANNDSATLTAFIPSRKYSLVYYYDKPVQFLNTNKLENLETYLNNNPQAYVVVEIKEMWKLEEKGIKNILIRSGKRYCLIQKMPKEIEEKETTKEPEIFVY